MITFVHIRAQTRNTNANTLWVNRGTCETFTGPRMMSEAKIGSDWCQLKAVMLPFPKNLWDTFIGDWRALIFRLWANNWLEQPRKFTVDKFIVCDQICHRSIGKQMKPLKVIDCLLISRNPIEWAAERYQRWRECEGWKTQNSKVSRVASSVRKVEVLWKMMETWSSMESSREQFS